MSAVSSSQGSKPAESLEWFERAIRTLASIYEPESRDATVREPLRNSHRARAMTLDRLERYAEAIKDWDKAIELSTKEEQSEYRATRTTSRLRAGHGDEAMTEVAELTKSSDWNLGQWYDFACVYAVASGKIADKKEAYAKRAVELLQKAVNAGWKDAAHIKTDTDLDPLRGREEFKTLLAELEARVNGPPGKK